MGLAMGPHRQATGQYVKEERNDSHHPHSQQGPPPSHIQQHPRSNSIVQQHHQSAPPQQTQQHSSAGYPYQQQQHHQQQHQQQSQPGAQHSPDIPYYAAAAQQSPYSTPGATSGYTSADTSEMMAAAMPRPPYPPMSYHTPQSNSPASVASPSGHDQQRSMYGSPGQLHQQSMYYSQQQYPPMPAQSQPSPYGQHPQPSPTSMMMNSAAQHQMSQHAHAHATQQHAQAGMTGSPRHPKIETFPARRPTQPAPMGPPSMGPPSMGPQTMSQSPMSQSQPPQNGAPLSTPGGGAGAGSGANVNPNAAPGPIPATTPLVVRQDQNGVQWIAFEYSRDRVKMEYTIRCDVESVNTDELSEQFKTDNCVYPRACVPKDQYRGNRLQYETECNTVGWALAELNPPLRGKRGLIQRAVDSWRNSNRDPRLRSRRVRRMAKITTRTKVSQPPVGHMPQGPGGMPGAPGSMGPGGPGSAGLGKPGMGMGGQMHPLHADSNGQGNDEVGMYHM